MRVLILASDALARAGLTALLSLQTNLQISGQAAPTDDLSSTVAVFRPDVLLWDVGWNVEQTLSTLSSVAETSPPIVALVSNAERLSALWATGVQGVLSRSLSAQQIAAALVAAANGLRVSDAALPTRLPLIPSEESQNELEPLTERELQVLQRMAEGLPNKQIARELTISEHTVKFHVNAILGKMQAQSRTEAVVRATRAGLILL
ncbi:MAG: response regulator transcription factor [Caldilineaceae bacterium]